MANSEAKLFLDRLHERMWDDKKTDITRLYSLKEDMEQFLQYANKQILEKHCKSFSSILMQYFEKIVVLIKADQKKNLFKDVEEFLNVFFIAFQKNSFLRNNLKRPVISSLLVRALDSELAMWFREIILNTCNICLTSGSDFKEQKYLSTLLIEAEEARTFEKQWSFMRATIDYYNINHFKTKFITCLNKQMQKYPEKEEMFYQIFREESIAVGIRNYLIKLNDFISSQDKMCIYSIKCAEIVVPPYKLQSPLSNSEVWLDVNISDGSFSILCQRIVLGNDPDLEGSGPEWEYVRIKFRSIRTIKIKNWYRDDAHISIGKVIYLFLKTPCTCCYVESTEAVKEASTVQITILNSDKLQKFVNILDMIFGSKIKAINENNSQEAFSGSSTKSPRSRQRKFAKSSSLYPPASKEFRNDEDGYTSSNSLSFVMVDPTKKIQIYNRTERKDISVFRSRTPDSCVSQTLQSEDDLDTSAILSAISSKSDRQLDKNNMHDTFDSSHSKQVSDDDWLSLTNQNRVKILTTPNMNVSNSSTIIDASFSESPKAGSVVIPVQEVVASCSREGLDEANAAVNSQTLKKKGKKASISRRSKSEPPTSQTASCNQSDFAQDVANCSGERLNELNAEVIPQTPKRRGRKPSVSGRSTPGSSKSKKKKKKHSSDEEDLVIPLNSDSEDENLSNISNCSRTSTRIVRQPYRYTDEINKQFFSRLRKPKRKRRASTSSTRSQPDELYYQSTSMGNNGPSAPKIKVLYPRRSSSQSDAGSQFCGPDSRPVSPASELSHPKKIFQRRYSIDGNKPGTSASTSANSSQMSGFSSLMYELTPQEIARRRALSLHLEVGLESKTPPPSSTKVPEKPTTSSSIKSSVDLITSPASPVISADANIYNSTLVPSNSHAVPVLGVPATTPAVNVPASTANNALIPSQMSILKRSATVPVSQVPAADNSVNVSKTSGIVPAKSPILPKFHPVPVSKVPAAGISVNVPNTRSIVPAKSPISQTNTSVPESKVPAKSKNAGTHARMLTLKCGTKVLVSKAPAKSLISQTGTLVPVSKVPATNIIGAPKPRGMVPAKSPISQAGTSVPVSKVPATSALVSVTKASRMVPAKSPIPQASTSVLLSKVPAASSAGNNLKTSSVGGDKSLVPKTNTSLPVSQDHTVSSSVNSCKISIPINVNGPIQRSNNSASVLKSPINPASYIPKPIPAYKRLSGSRSASPAAATSNLSRRRPSSGFEDALSESEMEELALLTAPSTYGVKLSTPKKMVRRRSTTSMRAESDYDSPSSTHNGPSESKTPEPRVLQEHTANNATVPAENIPETVAQNKQIPIYNQKILSPVVQLKRLRSDSPAGASPNRKKLAKTNPGIENLVEQPDAPSFNVSLTDPFDRLLAGIEEYPVEPDTEMQSVFKGWTDMFGGSSEEQNPSPLTSPEINNFEPTPVISRVTTVQNLQIQSGTVPKAPGTSYNNIVEVNTAESKREIKGVKTIGMYNNSIAKSTNVNTLKTKDAKKVVNENAEPKRDLKPSKATGKQKDNSKTPGKNPKIKLNHNYKTRSHSILKKQSKSIGSDELPDTITIVDNDTIVVEENNKIVPLVEDKISNQIMSDDVEQNIARIHGVDYRKHCECGKKTVSDKKIILNYLLKKSLELCESQKNCELEEDRVYFAHWANKLKQD